MGLVLTPGNSTLVYPGAGQCYGSVCVHTGERETRMACALGARVGVGCDIVLGTNAGAMCRFLTTHGDDGPQPS